MAMGCPRAQRPIMPDYGVDRSDWEPLPWPWVADRLVENRNFWLVTVSADGRPHALPLWAVWSESDLQLAFGCGPRSRKARNLDADSRAVVMIESTVECVSLEGTARMLEGERRETCIERFLAKYQSAAPSLTAEYLRDNAMYEFQPERGFSIIEHEDQFARRATKWSFEAVTYPGRMEVST